MMIGSIIVKREIKIYSSNLLEVIPRKFKQHNPRVEKEKKKPAKILT